MQKLSMVTASQTLGELYPSLNGDGKAEECVPPAVAPGPDTIALYDVVYASIIHQGVGNANN